MNTTLNGIKKITFNSDGSDHYKCYLDNKVDYGGYSDPDDGEWMYSETWFHEDGFEEKSLADIKAYIHETREHGLILGDKYITHDLVPSFYLSDWQIQFVELNAMIDLEEIGYFLFMEEQERKQKESAEEDSDGEDED